MALLPGGAVLVAGNGGERGEGGTTTPLLARYTCDGALDPAFGDGGVLPLDLGEFGQLHRIYPKPESPGRAPRRSRTHAASARRGS
ncbi:hypothetical protein WME91_30410 [Sorangium sp. So ce269]